MASSDWGLTALYGNHCFHSVVGYTGLLTQLSYIHVTSGRSGGHTWAAFQCTNFLLQCNELHPRCGNCTRLDIDCTWPGLDSRASSQSASSARQAPISPAHSTDHDSNSTTSTTALPLDDMRLMHHFMWRVALIYRYDAEFEKIRIWSVEVVDIAFEYPFLLHGILAIAAMHKTLEDPSADRSSLLEQADAHMSRSLAVYRQYLGHPTLETSLPTFLLSSLLVCYNLSSAGVEEPEQPIDAALHCFRLLRGIKVAIGDFWARLIEHPIVIHLLSGVVRADAVEIAEGKVYNEILVLKELAMQLDSAHREVYLRTVDSLHRTYLVADTCEDPIHVHNYFMTW